jgi:hypothetical protein
MNISGVIKDYIQGILLLLLAGFIIGSIQYVVSIIPDTTLSPSNQTTSTPSNPYLLNSYTVDVNGQGFGIDVNPVYCGPPQYTFYVVIDPSQLSNNAYPVSLTAWFTNGDTNQYAPSRYGSTKYYFTYVYIGWRCLRHIDFSLNTQSSGRVYVYLLDAPSIDNALAPWLSQTTNPSTPTITNKLVLSFISWVAGIVLILQALHKFDILI